MMKYLLILAALLLALVGVIHPAEAKTGAKKDEAGASPKKPKKVANATFDADEFLGDSCAERELAHERNVKLANLTRAACVRSMKADTQFVGQKEEGLAIKAYCPDEPLKSFVCEKEVVACENNKPECLSSEHRNKKNLAAIAKYSQCRKKFVAEAKKKRLFFDDVPELLEDRCPWPEAMEAELSEVDGEHGGYHGLGAIDTGGGTGSRASAMATAMSGSGTELVFGWSSSDERELRRQLKLEALKEKLRGKKSQALKPAPVNPWMDWH